MSDQEEQRNREGADSEGSIQEDARGFLAQLPSLEPLLKRLLTPVSSGSVSLNDEERDSISSDVLFFMAWCTSLSWDEVSSRLNAAGLGQDETSRVQEFADRNRRFSEFFLRAYRTDEGFENEITRLTYRPSLHLEERELLGRLEIYSHDKLLVVCNQELDDLLRLARYALEAAYDSLEFASNVNKELATREDYSRQIEKTLERAQKLRQIVLKGDPSVKS